MQRLNTATFYVGSRQTGLTSTENTLLKQAKDALKKALEKTNTFFNQDWKTYKEAIETLDVSPFKEIKQFNLE